MSLSRIVLTCEDVISAGEEMQNLGLCSALMAFVQRGVFIGSRLPLWHRTSVFAVSSGEPPHLGAPYHKQGIRWANSNPGPNKAIATEIIANYKIRWY
jgi:hypothetical protein